jgi:hypothetical protein
MNFVKVTASRIANGKILPKFLRMGKSDVRECKQSTPYGFESNPVKDTIAVYSTTDVIGDDVVIGYIPKEALTEIGESRVFSTDENGNLQVYIHLKKNGDIHFGGDSGNLTRYQELETAFNELKSDFNSLVNAFNTHTHPTAATGPPSVPTPVPTVIPVNPSTADITGAKIDEFKTL